MQTALRRFVFTSAEIEAEIERARFSHGLPFDENCLQNGSASVAKTQGTDTSKAVDAAKEPLNFSDAYDRYMADPTHAWSARTREAFETSRKLAVSVIGAETAIDKLSRAHCRDYIEVLRYLPRNSAKRFPKLTPRAASEMARGRGDIDVISPANANVYLGNLSSFLNWAVNEELLNRNPVRGLRLPDEVAKRDKRAPFSATQLKRIFNAPLYRGCLNGERGYSTVGDARPRNARFWVPLIALHTGMRMNEICQLDVDDIGMRDGISFVRVTEQSNAQDSDKILKTIASERVIPLHRNLIDIGLLLFVAEQRSAGHRKLFNDITVGRKGIRAVAFSKWFTQFSRRCKADDDRTCFHSFRHNFRDELRLARIEHDVSLALGGWSRGGSGKNGASENYGNGYSLEVLHEAVNRLTFASFDLSHLTMRP